MKAIFKDKTMQVKRFTSNDLEIMNSWYAGKQMPDVLEGSLPEVGFIVEDKACGFLYVADGGLAFIEGYITPEGLHHKDRSDALDAVTEALIQEAYELGVQKIMLLTQAQAIYDRAFKFGFDDIGYYRVLSKSLDKNGRV